MSLIPPTIAEFKTQFFRDFPYGSTLTTVQDQDIGNAIYEASFQINQNLFQGQSDYTLYYLYLAAHVLVMNLRASSQGISGQFNWLQGSKGVGAVSEGFVIPPDISNNPMFSAYCKTNYGLKYIVYIWPALRGQMFSVRGGTNP